ncbi:Uncharacterised protein [Vibrio cholerae]|nr:Uncharacterised protein [Vibrio cholerae]
MQFGTRPKYYVHSTQRMRCILSCFMDSTPCLFWA